MFRAYFDKYQAMVNGTITSVRSQRQLWGMKAQKPDLLLKNAKPDADHIDIYCKRAEEECADVLAKLEESYTCLECGQRYKGSENLGNWKCKAHSGHFGCDLRWSCCGRDEYAGGCVRSDHVSSAHPLGPEDLHLSMPLWLLHRFSIPHGRYDIVEHSNPYLMRAVVHRIQTLIK